MNVRVYVTPKQGHPRPSRRGRRTLAAQPRVHRGERRPDRQDHRPHDRRPDGLTAERRPRAGRRHVPQAARQPDHRGLHLRDQRGLRHELRAPCASASSSSPGATATPTPITPSPPSPAPTCATSGTRTPTSRASRPSSCPAASATATTCAAAPSRASARSCSRSSTSPSDGGLVMGICNGFQTLVEAGLLPGRPHPQHRAQVRLPLRQPARRDHGHALHQRLRDGRRCCASSSSTTRATTRSTRRRSRA